MDDINCLVMEALDMSEALDEAGDRKGGDLAQDLASHLFAKIIMTRKRAPGPMMPTATQRLEPTADDLRRAREAKSTQRVDHAANRRAADSLADSDALGMIDPARRDERVTVTTEDVAAMKVAADLVGDVAAAQRADLAKEAEAATLAGDLAARPEFEPDGPNDPFEDLR